MEVRKMETSSKFIIDDMFVTPPKGMIVTNWIQDNEPKFKFKPRKKKLRHFVLHENAGRSAKNCKATILRKGYGVHLVLDRKGNVSQHGDLATEVMIHANQLNKTSIGIEVINPYAPILGSGLRFKTIPAQWWTWCPDKNDRRYVLPTAAQLKTLKVLIPFLCEKLKIPYVFPTAGLDKKHRKVPRTGWRHRRMPSSGVVAHRDFSKHSDGRYLLEYLIKQKQD
jgi:hypothetical protein